MTRNGGRVLGIFPCHGRIVFLIKERARHQNTIHHRHFTFGVVFIHLILITGYILLFHIVLFRKPTVLHRPSEVFQNPVSGVALEEADVVADEQHHLFRSGKVKVVGVLAIGEFVHHHQTGCAERVFLLRHQRDDQGYQGHQNKDLSFHHKSH